MNKMAIDIKEARAIFLAIDEMVVPDLVVKRARLGHVYRSRSASPGAIYGKKP
jgi:hypothetical protein